MKRQILTVFLTVLIALAVPIAGLGQQDTHHATERATVKASNPPNHDPVTWHAVWKIEKRQGNWTGDDIKAGRAPEPYEVYKSEGNLLMTVGANILWTALTGGSYTAYSNSNAYV